MKEKKIDRVTWDNLEDYQQLKEISFFKNNKSENADIFIISMALGFSKNLKIPLKRGGKRGAARLDYFKDSDITLMKALAVKEAGTADILLDPEKVYKMAEEYAKGGNQILKKLMFGEEPGSYIKKICSDLLKIS